MKHTSVVVALALALSILDPVSSAAAEPTASRSPEPAFEEAVKLLEARRHAEAIPLLRRVLAAHPDDPAVLWNLGIASAEVGAHREALAAWTALRKVDPDHWRVGPKLIQAHQALGDTAARDAERAALYQARKAAPAGSELARLDRYCREQATIAGHTVFVYETFEPTGDRRVLYTFVILDDAGYERFRFSLGSYQSTTEFAWQSGGLPRDRRLYHLDRYDRGGHATYGFLDRLPSYEETREAVTKALSGALSPISGSGR